MRPASLDPEDIAIAMDDALVPEGCITGYHDVAHVVTEPELFFGIACVQWKLDLGDVGLCHDDIHRFVMAAKPLCTAKREKTNEHGLES